MGQKISATSFNDGHSPMPLPPLPYDASQLSPLAASRSLGAQLTAGEATA
jgi:hypothetical protein